MIFKVRHDWYDGPQVAVLRETEFGAWAGFGFFEDSEPLLEAMEHMDPEWSVESWPEGLYEWDGNTFRQLP